MMDNQTPVAQPVNWEAVRALAMVVGVREAARRMELSEDRVRQRSSREGWLASSEARKAVQLAHEARVAQKSVTTLSPAAIIHAEIASHGARSRVALARSITKAAEHVETMAGDAILAASSDVKNIAQTADLVHGWKDQAPSVKIRLDVLGAAQEQPLIDVHAEVTPTDAWDYEAELDEY